MSSVAEETMTMSTRVMTTPDTPDSVFKASFTASCNRHVRKDHVSHNGMHEIKRERTYTYNTVITRKSYMYMQHKNHRKGTLAH